VTPRHSERSPVKARSAKMSVTTKATPIGKRWARAWNLATAQWRATSMLS
jgi:hypothetical protein